MELSGHADRAPHGEQVPLQDRARRAEQARDANGERLLNRGRFARGKLESLEIVLGGENQLKLRKLPVVSSVQEINERTEELPWIAPADPVDRASELLRGFRELGVL